LLWWRRPLYRQAVTTSRSSPRGRAAALDLIGGHNSSDYVGGRKRERLWPSLPSVHVHQTSTPTGRLRTSRSWIPTTRYAASGRQPTGPGQPGALGRWCAGTWSRTGSRGWSHSPSPPTQAARPPVRRRRNPPQPVVNRRSPRPVRRLSIRLGRMGGASCAVGPMGTLASSSRCVERVPSSGCSGSDSASSPCPTAWSRSSTAMVTCTCTSSSVGSCRRRSSPPGGGGATSTSDGSVVTVLELGLLLVTLRATPLSTSVRP
jgi:hypothetical protein